MDSCTPPPNTIPDETQRRGQLVLRTLPIVLFPVIIGTLAFVILRVAFGIELESASDTRSPLVQYIVIAVFFTALIMLVRFGRPTASALLLISVWTLATTMTSLENGVESIWPALLIMPICAAGLLIDKVASISLAAIATLLIASVGWLELQGLYIVPKDWPPFVTQNPLLVAVAFWTVAFWTVAGLTSLLAGSLHHALKQSRMQAKELSELSAQLEDRVKAQTAKLLAQEREAAMLEERTRVARDIHDTLAQGLTGVVVQLGAAQRALSVAPGDVGQHLELAQRMARESLSEARRSIWNLRAPALERGDLGDALRGLASRPQRVDTSITFEQRGEPYDLSPDVESALLRVAQEALVNVSKHAEATQAQVVLAYVPDAVCLSISDNGKGFDMDVLWNDHEAVGPWSGFGLLGMRERIAALGGTLTLSNDAGAHVAASVPRVVLSIQHSALRTEA